jgi:hypothetical protein
MTAKEIFESIDLSQLPKEAADKFRKVEKATKGFTIESDKVNTFMRGAYKKIKETKPTALKNLKVEEKIIKKEVKKGKTTEVVENLEYKVKGTKKVAKKTPTPSKPKRSGETAMERARKIRKKLANGKLEPWKDALARAQKELKAEAAKAKSDADKAISTTSKALKSLEKMIQNDPKLKGYPRTYGKQSKRIDANKDAKIKAKPAGKRVSKKGHKNQYGESKGGRVYWENRDNRSDRYAPNFPNKVYLEMGGETDDLGFPTGHTFLVVEVSPDGTKNLIKSTKDYMTALMSSAVARGMKSNKDARVVIVDKEDKKVIHEAFESGGEITITPTQIVNNPDYLVGTTTMTELFEAGGCTAYQEGGEVFVTPNPLLNAGSGDYVAGSNTMSNMFADGGEILEDIIVSTKNFGVEDIFERWGLDYNFEGTNEEGRDEYIVYEVSQDYIDKIKSWPVQWRYAYAKGGEVSGQKRTFDVVFLNERHGKVVLEKKISGRSFANIKSQAIKIAKDKGYGIAIFYVTITDKFYDDEPSRKVNAFVGYVDKDDDWAFTEGWGAYKSPFNTKNVRKVEDVYEFMAKGGQLNWLDNQDEVEVKIGRKTILFDVVEFDDVYVFDPASEQDEDKVDDLMEKNENAVVDGLLRFLRKNAKGVAFSHDENHGGSGFAFKTDEKMESGGTIVAADPSAAMEDLNQTYGYESVYEKGGRVGFEGLAKKVAKRYEGKPVKGKYQKEYGKTYSKEEAMEVGRKVAAKVYGQQQANMKKMAKGGETDKNDIFKQYVKGDLSAKDYLNQYEKMAGRPAGSEAADELLKNSFLLTITASELGVSADTLRSKLQELKSSMSFAKGGSLDGHGLKSGDVIISQEGYLTKILDKEGNPLFVNLQDGYRGREKPLPFAKGGAVKGMKIPDIAKKFGKTTSDVFAQLQVGEKHEMEHTNDPKKARKIALDHLSKDLDYYTKLNKLGL